MATTQAERDGIIAGYREAIKDNHLGAYQTMSDYLLNLYLEALDELYTDHYFTTDEPLGDHYARVQAEWESRH